MPLQVTDAVGEAHDPVADSSERAELRTVLRALLARHAPPERVREFDEQERFDTALYERLSAAGLMALGSAPDAGDVRDQCVVVEELAAGPTSMAVYAIVHYMAVSLLAELGTPGQRAAVLDGLCTGRSRIAFALSEPGGGTDVLRAMTTTAQRTNTAWTIDGTKLWISGAAAADMLIVLARTAHADAGIDGITMFLVPAGAPGLKVTELSTLGVHGLDTCEVHLDGVTVDDDAVLGDVDRGFRQVLGTLNRERLTVAAGAVGAARGALDAAVAYAREREAFGKPIGAFQALQHRLVDDAIAVEAARSLTARAAAVEAGGGRADLLASMAKVAASEAAVNATQDGLQVLGGFGYSRDHPMQRWFRDVRLWTFSPLTNEMVRNYLGERLLGLPRSF